MVGLPALRALLSRRRRPGRAAHDRGRGSRRTAAGPGRAGRRTGRRRARPDHGHGQGRRRQDDDRRRPGRRAGPARQDRAPQHHRPGRAPGRRRWTATCRACRSSRIDPKVETQRYIDKIMAAKRPQASTRQEQALLLEDLHSPCTEEVAVFHAFSRIVSEGAQRLRRAGHRADRPHAAADGRDRRLPPADDARVRRPRRGAHRHAADAAAGRRVHAGSSW